jgi:hypothetical protein
MQREVLARYLPHQQGEHKPEHRYVTGVSREDILQKAQAQNPDSEKFLLACLYARIGQIRGPLVWMDEWLPAAEELVPA